MTVALADGWVFPLTVVARHDSARSFDADDTEHHVTPISLSSFARVNAAEIIPFPGFRRIVASQDKMPNNVRHQSNDDDAEGVFRQEIKHSGASLVVTPIAPVPGCSTVMITPVGVERGPNTIGEYSPQQEGSRFAGEHELHELVPTAIILSHSASPSWVTCIMKVTTK